MCECSRIFNKPFPVMDISTIKSDLFLKLDEVTGTEHKQADVNRCVAQSPFYRESEVYLHWHNIRKSMRAPIHTC